MPRIPRARHEGYDWAGRPIVRVLDDVQCADVIPTNLGLRQFSYTPDGTPIEAYGWFCCDAFCYETEIDDLSCFKLPDLWPLGPGPGIMKRIAFYLFDVNSCLSAVGVQTILNYRSADQKWGGTVTLRGCTLDLLLSVNVGDPTDPGKFTLEYSGGGDSGTLTVGYFCSDPLIINFGQVTLQHCCACPGTGSGTTDNPAEVNFYAATNCRPPRFGRHSYYDWDGTPVVVNARTCLWDQVDPDSCSIMTCPVNFYVANVADCSCLAGSYTGNYGTGTWEALGVGDCANAAKIDMTCTPAGVDSRGRTLVRLDITVECGVTTTGTASVTILATDLESLDVTVTISLTAPSLTCTDCLYEFNAMTAGWMLLSGCAGTGCSECPNTPVDPPIDPVDGQQYSESCPAVTPECCYGTITVRATRA